MNRRGTITRDFTHEKTYGSLVHGNELLLELDPNYPQDGRNFRVAQHTLKRILEALDQDFIGLPSTFRSFSSVQSPCDLFVGYLLLDALLANTDRHHENWGIILRPHVNGKRRAELAPTFDHASSLGRELSDQQRKDKILAETQRHAAKKPARRDQTIVGYLESDKGRSRIFRSEQDPKPLHAMKVFDEIYQQRTDAANAWLDKLNAVRIEELTNIVVRVPEELMPEVARGFCLQLLNLTHTALVNRTFKYD